MSIFGSSAVVENIGADFYKPNRSYEIHFQLFAKRRVATLCQRKKS